MCTAVLAAIHATNTVRLCQRPIHQQPFAYFQVQASRLVNIGITGNSDTLSAIPFRSTANKPGSIIVSAEMIKYTIMLLSSRKTAACALSQSQILVKWRELCSLCYLCGTASVQSDLYNKSHNAPVRVCAQTENCGREVDDGSQNIRSCATWCPHITQTPWPMRRRQRWRWMVLTDEMQHRELTRQTSYDETWFPGRTSCFPGSTDEWNSRGLQQCTHCQLSIF